MIDERMKLRAEIATMQERCEAILDSLNKTVPIGPENKIVIYNHMHTIPNGRPLLVAKCEVEGVEYQSSACLNAKEAVGEVILNLFHAGILSQFLEIK